VRARSAPAPARCGRPAARHGSNRKALVGRMCHHGTRAVPVHHAHSGCGSQSGARPAAPRYHIMAHATPSSGSALGALAGCPEMRPLVVRASAFAPVLCRLEDWHLAAVVATVAPAWFGIP